ncbi:MAG: hypothetical protein ACRYFX_04695 [Janthinobacterium lividum]
MEPQDPHFVALMQQLREKFQPAASLEEAGLKLTTLQVYERLQAFYPSDTYSPTTVYLALQQAGYTYDDPFQDMGYVWLFK